MISKNASPSLSASRDEVRERSDRLVDGHSEYFIVSWKRST